MLGLDWPGSLPPDYFWNFGSRLPADVRYVASREAIECAVLMLRRMGSRLGVFQRRGQTPPHLHAILVSVDGRCLTAERRRGGAGRCPCGEAGIHRVTEVGHGDWVHLHRRLRRQLPAAVLL